MAKKKAAAREDAGVLSGNLDATIPLRSARRPSLIPSRREGSNPHPAAGRVFAT
jgi:hypothetical protein